jgi:hypothetical protein
MSTKTIYPDIQEEILIALPDDYHEAVEVMAQLSANILLSGPHLDFAEFMNKVRGYHTAYVEGGY